MTSEDYKRIVETIIVDYVQYWKQEGVTDFTYRIDEGWTKDHYYDRRIHNIMIKVGKDNHTFPILVDNWIDKSEEESRKLNWRQILFVIARGGIHDIYRTIVLLHRDKQVIDHHVRGDFSSFRDYPLTKEEALNTKES